MKKILSIVLCLVMVFSLLPGFAFAAEGDPVQVDQKTSETTDHALHMQKTLYKNDDGTYDIVIESWATGTVESHVVTEAVPTDFVLILDQSGSMTTTDMPATYNSVAGPWTPTRVMNYNQTLYYKVTNADGTVNYYQVGSKDIPTGGLNHISPQVRDFGRNTGTGITAQINGNNVYAMDSTGAIYQVYRDTTAFLIYHNSEFYYYDAYGNRQTVDSQAWWGIGVLATNPSLAATNLYTMSGSNHGYGLYYKDSTGTEYQVADSSTVSAAGTTFYSGELYTTTGQMQSRLQALKNAVSGFVSTVQAKASEDGVNHRIAIVGFASDGTNYNQSRWENTELLTGVNVSGTNGRLYNNISDTDYRNALQDVTTSGGRTDLTNAINSIDAEGGTQGQYGFYMAENILEKRTVTTYVNKSGETANRNTVVLYFTDGHPGNFDTDDTIAAANTVVAAAKPVKQNQWKTTVFSVGIFASGDDQPLTFALSTSGMSNNQQQQAMQRDNYIRYASNYLYFRGNKVTQTPYNDTIADYMTCVSSVYPAASNFLTHSGGTSDTGSQSNSRGAQNQDHVAYYMRVTDASGLQQAFEAVANSIDTSSTSATVDSSAVLRDTVYTGDFDVSGGSVEAKSVKVQMVDGQVVETGEAGTADPTVTESVSTDGRLSVTGFDYSALYTTTAHPGEKLVVTIKNIEPRKGGNLYSNSGDASIYPGADSSDAVLGVASPRERVDRVTEVIDFNAKMTLATGVKRWKAVETISNGAYSIENGNFFYQLLPDLSMKDTTAEDPASLFMSGSDVALALSNDVVWKQYTAVPASSVYFDDDLLNTTLTVGDGSGYNVGVTASPASENLAKGSYTFTFVGTGIDVYCSTATDGGYVQGKIDNDTSTVQTIRNYDKEVTRYNVPTLSFRDLEAGQHVLTLNILGSSNYKFDGIRVYNPISEQDLYDGSSDEGDDTTEKYGTYINMREVLVNNETTTAFSDNMTDAVLGALFIDDASKLSTQQQAVDAQTGDPVVDDNGDPVMIDVYANTFDAYKANSPKHEIYLAKNQAITFQLTETAMAEGTKAWIGLSAPDAGKNTGTVTVNSTSVSVTSGVDMYYPLPAGASSITITNTGDNLISVTNLKITGSEAIYNAANAAKAAPADPESPTTLSVQDAVSMVFQPVTMRTVKLAANNGVDPDAPTVTPEDPEPTQQTIRDIVRQLLSDFVSRLFSSIGSLFQF